MKQTITLTESDIKRMIAETVRLVMESDMDEKVKSGKLANAIKKHGGLDNGKWSSSFGNDLYNMTDDDFDDYETVDVDRHYNLYGSNGTSNPKQFNNQNFKPIQFKDGTFMVKKNPSYKIDDREAALRDKHSERRNSQAHDGAEEYQYENPYLNQLINQTDMTPRGKWGFDNEKGNMGDNELNPLALKQKHIHKTYGLNRVSDDNDEREHTQKLRDLRNGNYKEDDMRKNIVGKAWLSSHGDKLDEAINRALTNLLG